MELFDDGGGDSPVSVINAFEELVGRDVVVVELNQGLPAEVDWPRKLSPWY